MLLDSFFPYLDSRGPRPRARHRGIRSVPSRLLLERLEDRTLLSFAAAVNYDVGRGPGSVAVGDFNGDGIPDLAVANKGNACDTCVSDVSILLGQGDGTFGATRNFPAGIQPSAVAVGDFNGDGIADLAVANAADYGGSPSVSILLGNGDSSFQAPGNFSAGPAPWSVAVADFNGDGIPDLAVANRVDPGTVSVLLGNGDGTFQAPRTIATNETNPSSVAVGDFNGDGKPDLVTDGVILLGNGDGTFRPPLSHGGGGGAVAVGDLNGDGVPDLAVLSGDGVRVLLGNGDGSFRVAGYFTTIAPRSVAVTDLNGDGRQDLVVGGGSCNLDSCADNSVRVLLGRGDGTFQPARSYATGVVINSVAVADFDGDGLPDAAAAAGYTLDLPGLGSSNPGSTVSILKGRADGTLQAAPTFELGFQSRPTSVTVGDFNGDGIADLATTTPGIGGYVRVQLGLGDGTFRSSVLYFAGTRPVSVAVGDFNGDGIQDLVVAGPAEQTVRVLLGNGDGSFQFPVSFPAGATPLSVVVADFNGDGIQDLAVGSFDGNSISVLLGNGDGTFGAARSFAVGSYPQSLAVGDFNGDGRLDLAVANRVSSTVSILLGNGDGTFQPAQNFPAGNYPASVAAADFNGDGLLDLAVTNGAAERAASVLLGNGDGTFQDPRNFAVGTNAYSVVVGDFDGDGNRDLAVLFDWGVRVLLGNGDGSFLTTRLSFAAGSNAYVALGAQALTLGDFDGDGWSDLAVANYKSNDVSILLNDGTGRGPGGAPGRGTGRGVHRHPLASFSLPAPSLSLSANGLPGTAAPGPAARKEPWIPSVVVDSLFAAPPPEESAVSGVPLLRQAAWGVRGWHARIDDLDLPGEVPATLAYQV